MAQVFPVTKVSLLPENGTFAFTTNTLLVFLLR